MTSPRYFSSAYAESSDPWRLSSAYELRKYALTVASLPRARYRRGFEPGCSVGVLTEMLSGRCDQLISTDVVEAPLAEAARRAPTAEVHRATIPQEWPDGRFDLVVLSEVLYYLGADDRRQVIDRLRDCLVPGGHVVLVHWRHAFDEAECDGDTVHDEVGRLGSTAGWSRVVEHVERDFRLEVFERAAS